MSGIGVFDNTLMFFTTGGQTDSVSSSALTIRGTPARGLAARVIIPQNPDTTTTILPRIWTNQARTGGTWRMVAQYQGGAIGILTAAKEVLVPFVDLDAQRVALELLVTGNSGSFGEVIAGLVENSGGDWSRAADFS